MNFLVLLTLSLSPGLAIVLFIYFRDKYEKEPLRALLMSFGYGVLVLLAAELITELLNTEVKLHDDNLMEQAFRAFILVSLLEEALKFSVLRFRLYNHKDFDEPFDGIVYSVMVGMGFATAENIVYVFSGGIDVGIVRMFTAVPAHATFAIIMGYFVGQAKFLKQRTSSSFKEGSFLAKLESKLYSKPRNLVLAGLLLSVIAHGIYDYFLFITFVPGIWVGSFITLGLAIYFSKKAMDKQVAASPFKDS